MTLAIRRRRGDDGERIDLRRVRYFLALSENLSFSCTARRLGITQPALTKALRVLEEELGGRLVRREGRTTHLTDFGQSMLGHCEALVACASRMGLAARRESAGLDGRLRVALLPGTGGARTAAFFARYAAARPEVRIEFVDVADAEALLPMLERGGIDCALTLDRTESEDRVRRVPLFECPLKLVHPARHRLRFLGRVGAAELERLAGERAADLDVELGRGAMFLARRDAERRAEAETRCPHWLQALVAAGFGVAIVPSDLPVHLGLGSTPLAFEAHGLSVSANLPRGRVDNPVVRGFADFLDAWPGSAAAGEPAIGAPGAGAATMPPWRPAAPAPRSAGPAATAVHDATPDAA